MRYTTNMTGNVTVKVTSRSFGHEEHICWSRMQAEAGQPLEVIVARKEAERVAGAGLFFWGVGNPPAVVVNALVHASVPVRAVFSVMKSRPKKADIEPTQIVVWRRYIDAYGVNRPLPPHTLVTSRGSSASGTKRVHYALVCRSDKPLRVQRGEPFDPSAFRNAGGTGAPVGASQVTALLRRVTEDSGRTDYEANISAWLTDSYWVRLLDPVVLDDRKLRMLVAMADLAPEQWCEKVTTIRKGATVGGVQVHGTFL